MVKRTEFGISIHDEIERRDDPKRSDRAKRRDMERRAAASARRLRWEDRA